MNKSVLLGVLAALVGTIVIVVGAFALLRSPDNAGGAGEAGEASEASEAGEAAEASISTAPVSNRPACPGSGVGGVALECLGSNGSGSGSDPATISVVNVWAWWCQPCRAELPVIEQYAVENPDINVVGVHADPNAGNGADLLNDLGVGIASYQDPDNTFAGALGLPGVIPLTLVFRGAEQIGLFVQTFESAAELEAAVAGVL